MNFFSVFSGDGASEPSGSDEHGDHGDHGGASVSNSSDPGTVWSFGGLIQTLATKSESVFSTYRRDLEELGSGLRKETSVIREVASRAVQDLPTTLDVGAAVAQESLESVGQAIDDIGSAFWKSTSKIISHGRETILAADLVSGNHENNSDVIIGSSSSRNLEFKQYNRFNSQLAALQRDLNTYLEEPEDFESYEKWKLGFVLDDKGDEIDNLIKESEDVREIHRTVVPSTIAPELFWSRYFYKLHKLKQAEEARAKLVKRAMFAKEEEDLSWDVEDDDETEENSSGAFSTNSSGEGKNAVSEGSDRKSEVKTAAEGIADGGDSCKDSDISIISSQAPPSGEEELGWDEIEEVGTIDEAKSNTKRIDLQKRLIAAEGEEDLSWDIEDEDEPTKS